MPFHGSARRFIGALLVAIAVTVIGTNVVFPGPDWCASLDPDGWLYRTFCTADGSSGAK